MGRRRLGLATILLLVCAGCGDDGTTSDSPVGSYHATELTATSSSGTTDLLAAGAELTMVLSSQGTTTGTLVIPAAFSESGNEETVSLAGNYDYDAATGVVTFTQSGDTFVRDMTWILTGDELHGELTSAGTTIAATLQR